MENVEMNVEPAWLEIMRRDVSKDALTARILGISTLAGRGRAMVWEICRQFGCLEVGMGVLNQTVRVFERFLAGAVRLNYGSNKRRVWRLVKPHLTLYLCCCFELASKTFTTADPPGPNQIREYLMSIGLAYTIEDIMNVERKIFRMLGYHLPTFASMDMAELLSGEVEMEPSVLPELRQTVHLVELRRHDVELEVRWVINLCRMDRHLRVSTFHLAAGCVAATVRRTAPGNYFQTVDRLVKFLRVKPIYFRIVADVIALWVKPEAPSPVWMRRRRPNMRRRCKGTIALAVSPEDRPVYSNDPYDPYRLFVY